MTLIFAVLYTSLNEGPCMLLQNGSFFTFIIVTTQQRRESLETHLCQRDI